MEIPLDLTNLQEQVKKAFCFKNCIDLSNVLKFKTEVQKFARKKTVGQDNFRNKILFLRPTFSVESNGSKN